MKAFENRTSSQQLVVVVYDISDDKKRYKVAKLLNKFGVRVQKSVFECQLNNIKYKKLCDGIEKLYTGAEYIRIYRLSDNDIIKNWGDTEFLTEEDHIFF